MCEPVKITGIVFTNIPLSKMDIEDFGKNPQKYIENGTHMCALTKDGYITSIE